MTQQTAGHRAVSLRERLQPAGRQGGRLPPWWRVSWSEPAAFRALRATLVVPAMLALTFKVIGDPQMAIFAVFGSFGALVLTTFGGSRKNKLVAHLGLAVAGSVTLIIGTVVSGSAVVAALVTLPVGFAVYFAGLAGPNVAAGITAVLLAYVLPVASAGGASSIPSRLEGWWLAQAVSTIAVLVLSPPSAGDRLRQSASALASALATELHRNVDGIATAADRDATVAAKDRLLNMFAATPYRPIGLAAADQALASLISVLEWCTSLASEMIDSNLHINAAPDEDRDLITESASALDAVAALLAGHDAQPSLQQLWHKRSANATHLRGLTGEPGEVRELADQAFHAQAIGIAATAVAADALIATGRLDAGAVEAQRRRWIISYADESDKIGRSADVADGGRCRMPVMRPMRPRATSTLGADASIRSVWFRNAARGAAALALAVGVAKAIDVQHAFWVVLGTLSVLRSSAGATGSTAARAVAGTAIGFFIGGALLIGIGTAPVALWVALPLAVLVAAYTPGTAPFVIGQAAFTVVVVVLFNILVPVGWKVGLVRIEDVAIGCAVSVVVGVLFWPRGASALVGDNLADALRAGAKYLTDATDWALGSSVRQSGQAEAAVAASIRLDDAVRGFLTEQGSKRVDKQDLWALTMSALRLRLTAHSMASLPGLTAARGPAAEHRMSSASRAKLTSQAGDLADFYRRIADQVGKPARDAGAPVPVPVPREIASESVTPCRIGPVHYHPEALWVLDHLVHLQSHSAALPGPAARLAEVRRTPWWRAPSPQAPRLTPQEQPGT